MKNSLKIKKSRFFIILIFVFTILLIFSNISILPNLNNTDNNLENNVGDNSNKNNITIKSDEYELERLYTKYKEKKLLVLTFDDGPSKYTPMILDTLKQNNINATFFVMGQSLEKNSNILEKSLQNGNEIGIHCYSHKLFTRLSNDEIKKQIETTKKLIKQQIGITPNLIRVPYGSLNKRVENLLLDEGFTSILWSVDSLDWKFKNTNKTYNYILKKTTGNDIILMHDTFKSSYETVSKIIPYYKEKGYLFVTVSKFLEVKNYAKEHE